MSHLTIAMMVLNEEEFIWYNLKQHYEYADKIIIIEGADKRYPNELITPNGESTDRTKEIIQSFHDPDKKIKFYSLGWTTKNDMAHFYIKLIKDGWLLRIDGDEFYTHDCLKKIHEYMSTTQKDTLIYPIYHLWKGYTHHITGGFYSVPHMKLMRITPECNFSYDHVRLCYADGKPYAFGEGIRKNWIDDIYMVHLGFARKNEIRYNTNVQYYKNVGEIKSRPEYVRAREMWNSNDIDSRYIIRQVDFKLPEIFKECLS